MWKVKATVAPMLIGALVNWLQIPETISEISVQKNADLGRAKI